MNRKLSLSDMAERAMKEAVFRVIMQHKTDRRPLAIWKDEKVVYISAEEALKDYDNKI
jgi:hypothetical protein